MSDTITLHDLSFKPFINEDTVLATVKRMARRIEKDYAGKCPVFLVILNGAFRFAADLAAHMDMDCEWQFVKLASYEGTESTGIVREANSITTDLRNRHIIVVEDIVDRGLTMKYYFRRLEEYSAASTALASLLLKEEALEYDIRIDYLGMKIPDRFVVGYGLDYDGLGRNINGIWQEESEGK